MWHTDKTDTRLFCGFLRKTWLRIAITTGEKTMKLLNETMHQKRTSETMQFHCSLIEDAALAQIAISPSTEHPALISISKSPVDILMGICSPVLCRKLTPLTWGLKEALSVTLRQPLCQLIKQKTLPQTSRGSSSLFSVQQN